MDSYGLSQLAAEVRNMLLTNVGYFAVWMLSAQLCTSASVCGGGFVAVWNAGWTAAAGAHIAHLACGAAGGWLCTCTPSRGAGLIGQACDHVRAGCVHAVACDCIKPAVQPSTRVSKRQYRQQPGTKLQCGFYSSAGILHRPAASSACGSSTVRSRGCNRNG